MTRLGKLLLLSLTVLVILLEAGASEAQQVTCQVLSIRASSDASQLSLPLEPFRMYLQRSPFNSFSSFHLLDTGTIAITQGNPSPITLANGINGTITLDSTDATGHILNVSLSHGSRSLVTARLRATRGHPSFFVVGSNVIPDGTLVVGIVCQ